MRVRHINAGVNCQLLRMYEISAGPIPQVGQDPVADAQPDLLLQTNPSL